MRFCFCRAAASAPAATQRLKALRYAAIADIALLTTAACASGPPAVAQTPAPAQGTALSAADEALLEDLSKRSFMFFWEQADPGTGIVRDRSRTDGSPVPTDARDV